MRRTKEQKALDEELIRECQGYTTRDNKPDGAYIQVSWLFYNTNKIKRLIEKGADVHSKKRDGTTLLHLAVGGDNTELAKFLIDSGAKVNVKKRNGETPLHLAVFRNIELAKLLIDSGADVNAKEDRYGRTSLHLAVAWNKIEIAKLLIDSGADVEAKNNRGETTLRFWMIKHLKEATRWGGGRVNIPYDFANILIKAGATF